MEGIPKELSRRKKTVEITEVDVRFEDGKEATFWLREDPEVVCGVALDSEGQVLLVRQFRIGHDRVVDDLPGGRLEPGEHPLDGYLRELREETGHAPDFVNKVTQYHNGSNTTRVVHVFLATGCHKVSEIRPDNGEIILGVIHKPLDEFIEQVKRGQLSDFGAALACLQTLDHKLF